MTSTKIKLSKGYLTRDLISLQLLRTFHNKSYLIMNRDSINPFSKRDNGTYRLNFDVLSDLIVAICKNTNMSVVSISYEILSCNEPYIQADIIFSCLRAYLSKQHDIELFKQPRYYGDGWPIQGTYIYISGIGIRSSLAGGYIDDFEIQAYLHKVGAYRQYEADYVIGLEPPYGCSSFISIEHRANRKYEL